MPVAYIPAGEKFRNLLEQAFAAWAGSPLRVYGFEQLDSTMDAAVRLARLKGQEIEEREFALACISGAWNQEWTDALVVARVQSSGRGQGGRRWYSAFGEGIYLTYLTFPEISPVVLSGLSPFMGLAVLKTLRQFGIEGKIKLPNDVFSAEAGSGWKKICGILTESSSSQGAVRSLRVGVGLNLNQLQFPDEICATSMRLVKGSEVSYSAVLRVLSEYLTDYLRRYYGSGEKAFGQELADNLYHRDDEALS